MNLLHSLLMLKRRTMQVQRNNVKEDRVSNMEGREEASFVTGLDIMIGSVLIEGIHFRTMTTTTTTTTILGATPIKGIADSTTKEKGMLSLLNMEMVDLPKDQETPSMMNLML